MTIKGFYRDGTEAGEFAEDRFERGGFGVTRIVEEKCHRCGGLGGSDAWKYTGWTCYECGGRCTLRRTRTVRIYTADKLAKLNAAADKRRAKREAEYAAKREAEEARIAAEREEFRRAHAATIALVNAYAGDEGFLADMRASIERCFLTEKMVAAIGKACARIEGKRIAVRRSAYAGEIGDRVEFTVTKVEEVFARPAYGWNDRPFYIARIETAEGPVLTYKGGSLYSWIPMPEDMPARVRFTVKDREEFRGLKQTIVARPHVIEEVRAA